MNALVPVAPAEVLPPAAEVFLQRSPFTSAKPVLLNLPEGMTLQGYADAVLEDLPPAYAPHLRLYIGEHEIPRTMWRMVKPKPGNIVTVRVLPAGDGGKNILRAVVMIAVVAAAMYALGPAGIGLAAAVGGGVVGSVVTALAVAAIAFTAQLALNALIPPPRQGQGGERRDFLTGGQNAFDPYGAIPRVFGRHRVYPKIAAHPFTEVVGKKHYLRMLLLVGYGPLRVSDIRIGNTPLSAYVGVELEVSEGGPEGWGGNKAITLYNQQVNESQFSITLDNLGDAATQTTEGDVTEIGVDVVFPQGLIGYNKKGEHQKRTVDFQVTYREAGTTGSWRQANWISDNDNSAQRSNGILRASDTSQEQTLISGRWKVTKGKYDVRVERRTAKGKQVVGGTNEIDKAVWSTLRSVVDAKPVNMDGLCLIAIRIRASDQLNGVVQNINCLAEAYLPVTTDGVNWDYQITRSPAWAYADLLRRRGRETLLPDKRVDIPAIMAWADACKAAPANDPTGQAWTYDGPIEGGSVFDAARQVAAVGRATFAIRDGKFSVTRDVVQAAPVQHFTPRNTWGYSAVRTYADLPHALKVRFLNEEKDYSADEIYVYADGFNEANASRFDTLDLPGATRTKLAWREGRYHLAVGYARQEEHTLSADIENLRCTTGDRVQLAHDVILVGQAYGRVLSRLGGATVTGVNLDTAVVFEQGKNYQLRIRHSDGTSSVRVARSPAGVGTFTQVLFQGEPAASAPAPDDLFMFGETGLETAPMVVKKIEAGEDLSAKLTLVAYDPKIQMSDTGPLPVFTSYISNPVSPMRRSPPAPRAISVRSDDTAIDIQPDGTATYRLAVDILPGGTGLIPVAWWDVQFRESDETGLAPGTYRPSSGTGRVPVQTTTTYCQPVRIGQLYDVRARSVSENGLASEWVELLGHTTVGKQVPPADPVPGPLVPFQNGIGVRWAQNVTDADYASTAILHATANDFSKAVRVGMSPGVSFNHQVPYDEATDHFYWLIAYDTTGNPSNAIYVGGARPLPTVATDVENVAGVPAQQVVDDINFNAATMADELVRGANMRALFDFRTIMADGATPIRTFVQQASEQQQTDKEAFAQTISLLGAKAPGGNSFQLNLDTTLVKPGESLSSRLSTISASFGDQSASIDTLNEVLIDPSGATARAVLKIVNGDTIGGFYATATATEASFRILADVIQFVDPNGGQPYTPFQITNGIVRMTNVEVDTIKAGSVTIAGLAAGLSVARRFTSGDVAINAGEVTLCETPLFDVGDGTSPGNALATISFEHDGTAVVDTAASIRIYLDVNDGAGYVKQGTTRRSGIQVSSGNAKWVITFNMNLAITALGKARIRVTGQGLSIGGGPTSGSTARAITVDVLRIGR